MEALNGKCSRVKSLDWSQLSDREADRKKEKKMKKSSLSPFLHQRKHSAARSAFAYLAVEETGHSAADVARVLGVKRMSVHEAVARGETLSTRYALLGDESR